MLGQGTFGQVVECVREDHGHERLAVKVIKNQQAYFQQVHCRCRTHCVPPCVPSPRGMLRVQHRLGHRHRSMRAAASCVRSVIACRSDQSGESS